MSRRSSHDSSDDDFEPILKPRPKRPFEIPSTPTSPTSSQPSLHAHTHSMDGASTPARTRSFLNLTTSTLFGIYSQTGFTNEKEESATPWGTGAQTPLDRQNALDLDRADKALSNGNSSPRGRRRRRSSPPRRAHKAPRRGFRGYYFPLIARVIALFCVGVLYGLLITHLHDRRELAPTKVDIDRNWNYLAWWGLAGAALGEIMPWVDTFWWEDNASSPGAQKMGRGIDDWMAIVRSIGAFVGVAYAIRKLPWQSTLQLSLTLALANPAIWFIVDRSPPGFVLSTAFAFVGTLVLLGMNPALMPSPSPAEVLKAHVMRNGGLKILKPPAAGLPIVDEELILGVFTSESVGVATWIASVLFVSSVCFGNIGRRLAWD